MLIKSNFLSNQTLSTKYTCDGENVSPPLFFEELPIGCRSLVLIMDDPDAPNGTFDHWIVWNISPAILHLSEGAPELNTMSPLPSFGLNHYETLEYKGPCPPPGKPHHYHFKLYALNTRLSLFEGTSKQILEKTMKEHILDQAEIVGIYQRFGM